MHFQGLVKLFVASPLVLLFPLVYFLLECIDLKEYRKWELISDRDYGHGVSGKHFLLALGTVAVLVVCLFFLLLVGKGKV